MNMDSKWSELIPLLKYPVLIFSILIAMVFARWILGIDFSRLSKVGAGGVEFFEEKEQQISAAMSAMEERLNESRLRIQNLEEKLNLQDVTKRIESQNFEATQRVSEEVAQLSRSADPAKDTVFKNKQVYIWIGNYNRQTQKWEQPQIATLDGQPPSQSPREMAAGSQYTVLGNLQMRDSLPENDAAYFRSQKNIGTIPRGTKITFLSEPQGINREYALQYWVKVEVNE
jgi:hypothetical protein